MFFGDPYKFAIQCDVINEWNDDCFWINGIFNIYIDGVPILGEVYTSELKFTLANFTEEVLFSMKSIEFSEFNHFNEIVDNIAFNIGSSEMEDKEIYVYFVFNKNNDYVLLKSKGNVTYFKYDKGYIFNVLLSISQWKNTVTSF